MGFIITGRKENERSKISIYHNYERAYVVDLIEQKL